MVLRIAYVIWNWESGKNLSKVATLKLNFLYYKLTLSRVGVFQFVLIHFLFSVLIWVFVFGSTIWVFFFSELDYLLSLDIPETNSAHVRSLIIYEVF